MRLKVGVLILAFALSACSLGAPFQATPEPVPIDATLAPYSHDTPSPPTIPAPVISAPGITTLHMLNELDGWGIAEAAILRTTDGGFTWYDVSPPGVTAFGYGVGYTFLNTAQAWVLVADANDPVGAGTLFRTTNGGLTWESIPVPFGSGVMTFIDEEVGWLMHSLGVAAGSMAVALYRSADGGKSWSQVYTNDPNFANAGDSLPLGGIKTNLTPLNAQVAFVGGVIYSPETFYFYRTVDSGRTWMAQPMPAAPGMQNTEVSIDTGPIFTSPNDGILPIRFTGETLRTGFYVTHDAGQTWEFVAFLPGAGAVDFTSSTDGFFWTGEQFFSTVDGGATWASIAPDILFGDTFSGMDFVNSRTGWLWTYDQTGQRGLYRTTDGGGTWYPLE